MQRALRHVCAQLSSHCDRASFMRMTQLAMTATNPNLVPTVVIQYGEERPNIHVLRLSGRYLDATPISRESTEFQDINKGLQCADR